MTFPDTMVLSLNRVKTRVNRSNTYISEKIMQSVEISEEIEFQEGVKYEPIA